MLTTIVTIVTISLILLLAAVRLTRNRSTCGATAYVCDICNEQDCQCRRKP